jgi:hypothetical protein
MAKKQKNAWDYVEQIEGRKLREVVNAYHWGTYWPAVDPRNGQGPNDVTVEKITEGGDGYVIADWRGGRWVADESASEVAIPADVYREYEQTPWNRAAK